MEPLFGILSRGTGTDPFKVRIGWYGHLEASKGLDYLMQSCWRPPKMGRRTPEKRPKGHREGRKRPKTKRSVVATRLPYAKLSAAPDLVRPDDLGKAVGQKARPEKAKMSKNGGKTTISGSARGGRRRRRTTFPTLCKVVGDPHKWGGRSKKKGQKAVRKAGTGKKRNRASERLGYLMQSCRPPPI